MKQTLSILIVLFVFIGSNNITVNQHICGGKVQSVSLFFPAEECEHAAVKENTPPCHAKSHCDEKSDNKCCDENQIIIQASKWFQVESNYAIEDLNGPSNSTINFNTELLSLYINSEESLPEKIPDPPWLKCEHFIWHEALLI